MLVHWRKGLLIWIFVFFSFLLHSFLLCSFVWRKFQLNIFFSRVGCSFETHSNLKTSNHCIYYMVYTKWYSFNGTQKIHKTNIRMYIVQCTSNFSTNATAPLLPVSFLCISFRFSLYLYDCVCILIKDKSENKVYQR